MKRLFPRSFAVVFAAAAFFVYAPPALAQQAGYDFLQTPPGGAAIGVGIPGVSPSTVSLEGVPICPCTGQTDTIMHRGAAGAGGHADLKVVALFLKNSVPVTHNGSPVDVYVTINNSDGVIGQNVLPQRDSLLSSTGSLTIRADGTFDSSFTVHADIIVVAKGADVRNPSTPVIAHMAAPPVSLSANNNVWTAVPPAGYPSECFFPGNGFYPGGPVPETAPTGPHQHPVVPSGPPPGGNGARCIIFNPATAAVQQVSGRWKVVDGGQPLFDFDSRQADAQKTLSIIQHYHMTQTCTVGTNLPGQQNAPMEYELVGAAAPTGTMPGEDCIGDNPATVTDQDIDGRWTITDGLSWMFNFGPQKPQADQGVAIIKHYNFNQLCYVGRPDTGGRFVFVYMKAGAPLVLPRGPIKEFEMKRPPLVGPGPVERVPEIKPEIIKK
jgi:hypothetical protein